MRDGNREDCGACGRHWGRASSPAPPTTIPSGIATYSQAGAQFGYALTWTMFLTLPFMAAIQIISAWIGWQTRQGLARNLARELPPAAAAVLVALLVVANTINIAADLAAMGEALRLVIGGRRFSMRSCSAASASCWRSFIPYHRYARHPEIHGAGAAGLCGGGVQREDSVGRSRARDLHSKGFARPRHDPDRRGGVRHDHQPVPVLLAGLAGGRRSRA